MIAVVHRVAQARLTAPDQPEVKIGQGYLVLLGVGRDDQEKDSVKLATKIAKLRIMADADQKMNLTLTDAGGELLVVSQFTLLADVKGGNRPSFIQAADPEKAEQLYQVFVQTCRDEGLATQTGYFGAYMQVELTNDGPVTIILDSKTLP